MPRKAAPAPAAPKKLKAGFVTLNEAAARVGKDRRTLSRYRSEGMIGLHYDEDEGVNWLEFLTSYTQRKIDDATKGTTDEELKQASRRERISKAKRAQAVWQMMEGSTARIEDFEQLAQSLMNEVVVTLKQWPRTGAASISAWFGTQLKGVTDQHPELARHLVFDVGALERYLQEQMNDLIGTTGEQMADTVVAELIKRAKIVGAKGV